MKSLFKAIKNAFFLSMTAVLFAASASAQQSFIYAHSAGFGQGDIDIIDAATGAIDHTCSQDNGNGRGIVVVGNTGYYTVAESGTVWKINIDTCEELGVAFDTGLSGIATIAYTGSSFWVNQYDSNPPGNGAYEFSPDGTLLNSITLSECGGYCDGVEYFEGKLISNRGDAVLPIYDVYDLDGNLLDEGFIDDPQGGSTTGIAYDGTNFWVSDIFQNRLRLYDGGTGEFIQFVDITGASTLIEDLSVDYAQRPDTGGGGEPEVVPTLGIWGMIIAMFTMMVIGGIALRRFR